MFNAVFNGIKCHISRNNEGMWTSEPCIHVLDYGLSNSGMPLTVQGQGHSLPMMGFEKWHIFINKDLISFFLSVQHYSDWQVVTGIL